MCAKRLSTAATIEAPKHVWLKRLSDVAAQSVEWLWPGRVPRGKVTLLVGDPGRGKSLMALDMAARVTRGLPWPDGSGNSAAAGRVILLSAEDDAADTIRPRLEAAGGDPSRVLILRAILHVGTEGELLFSLAHDLEVLEACVRQCEDVRLVILDPVSAYLAGADAQGNAAIRAVLAPLRGLAERSGAAVVAISHLTKKSDAALMYRTMGSLAFVAAARAVWAVGPDREASGRLLFLPVKCNLAGGVTGLAYRIEPSVGDAAVPVLAWETEPVALTAEEALGVGMGRPSKCETAARWLQGVLSRGPLGAADVERMALAAGFSVMTLRRARHALGVISSHSSLSAPRMLRLPGGCSEADEMASAAGEDRQMGGRATPAAETP